MVVITKGNRVFLNEKNIIEVLYEGDQTYESVMEVTNRVVLTAGRLKEEGRPVLILNSLQGIAKTDPGSRKASYEALTASIPYDRIALYKTSRYLKYVANIIIKASGKGKYVRYFDSREEAESWLMQKS